MRITTKGQVTVQQDMRERAGLMPGTDVDFEIEAGVVRLVKRRLQAAVARPGVKSSSKPVADGATSK